MKERVHKVVKRYLSLLGYEYLDTIVNGFLVFNDEDDLVFVNCCWAKQRFAESEFETLRSEFEEALAEWYSQPEHIDRSDYVVRCDEISVNVVAEERALVRHTRNAIARAI